ncbi:MAG: alpha/beta fold hydrolase [Acidobacteria bacterium]|nr:alpha/beta fold hydrolase [Acidobacteriota bacterium]
MNNRRRLFWIISIAALFLLAAGYQFLNRSHIDESKEVRTLIRDSVKQRYPDLVHEMQSRYGLKPANGPDSGKEEDSGIKDVILIHGMDDPGKVWMNLSPLLQANGFRVWILSYPNDQPIYESARFFFEEMKRLGGTGRANVSIVAHSMGGLVAREMLSNPELSYGRAALEGRVPTIADLIMVATPNHGSELAQFRILGEFRDQLAGLLSGDYIWLQGILDGAGEAGLDLIPDSPFMKALNSRPHPEGLSMIVIAGVMTPWKENDLERFIDQINNKLPESAHDSVAGVGDVLKSMANGLGDGLVSVDSARLNGIPLHIVQGNHLSIIRNVSKESERVPPALPIIMDFMHFSLSGF